MKNNEILGKRFLDEPKKQRKETSKLIASELTSIILKKCYDTPAGVDALISVACSIMYQSILPYEKFREAAISIMERELKSFDELKEEIENDRKRFDGKDFED